MIRIEEGSKQKTQLEQELTEQLTDELSDRVAHELMNVDFSSIKVPRAVIHPKWELLLQFTQLKVTEELGQEFKLIKDICDYSFYAFPSQSFDLVGCILIFNMAFFAIDDHLMKCPDDVDELTKQIRSKQFSGSRSIDKWLRLCMKVLREAMKDTAIDQLLDIIILTLSKTNEMIRLCSDPTTVADKDFLELRWVDAGALHQFFFVLIGAGNQLTHELQNDSTYLAFNKQLGLYSTLVNDIYSLRREIRDRCFKYNFVYVKMKHCNLTAQEATNEIINKIDECERMARVYGEILKKRNDLKLTQYVKGMYDLMAGNHYWSTFCKRYNSFN